MLRPGVFLHTTCRNNVYPKSNVARFMVPDECVFWQSPYPDYRPHSYTAPHIIKGQIWADPEQINGIQFNKLDGNVNRISFHGDYCIQSSGHPQNPFGRTGLVGRGLLGRWGPNHAADPIVTRWKRNDLGETMRNDVTKKQILQMVAIKRHDNGMWAIPGGMVDPGEKVSSTLKREFMEEALNSYESKKMIDDFFCHGVEIYKGYVDDYRNTDNAWMETVAYSFHDEDGTQVGKFTFSAGDDAADVKWLDIDSKVILHANHIDILREVVQRLNAHW